MFLLWHSTLAYRPYYTLIISLITFFLFFFFCQNFEFNWCQFWKELALRREWCFQCAFKLFQNVTWQDMSLFRVHQHFDREKDLSLSSFRRLLCNTFGRGMKGKYNLQWPLTGSWFSFALCVVCCNCSLWVSFLLFLC